MNHANQGQNVVVEDCFEPRGGDSVYSIHREQELEPRSGDTVPPLRGFENRCEFVSYKRNRHYVAF